MTKLNQIIAIEKGVKSEAQRILTDSHHLLKKEPLLQGLSRTYQPREEDGDMFPDEHSKVQVTVGDQLKKVNESLMKLFDVTLTKDVANTHAKADIVVDGRVIVKDVPVTTLLFLEKKLVDIHTFVKQLPVLSASDDWEFDDATNMFRTKPTNTLKTKKVMRNHVKAAATDKHPAQVEVFTEDVPIGTWSTVKFSGAVTQRSVSDMLTRIEKLQQAVKFAREEANGQDVSEKTCGKQIFNFIFS